MCDLFLWALFPHIFSSPSLPFFVHVIITFIFSLKLDQVSIEHPFPSNILPLSQQEQPLIQREPGSEVLQVQNGKGRQAFLKRRRQVC
jgi:hypothetical protein